MATEGEWTAAIESSCSKFILLGVAEESWDERDFLLMTVCEQSTYNTKSELVF